MAARDDRCPHCILGGYIRIEDSLTGKPQFKCERCGATWTSGKRGGKFLQHAKTPRRD